MCLLSPVSIAVSSTARRLRRYSNISLLTSGILLWLRGVLSKPRLSTRAGIPMAVESAGTFFTTTELAPTFELAPMVIFPSIFAPAPMTTPSSRVGCLLPLLSFYFYVTLLIFVYIFGSVTPKEFLVPLGFGFRIELFWCSDYFILIWVAPNIFRFYAYFYLIFAYWSRWFLILWTVLKAISLGSAISIELWSLLTRYLWDSSLALSRS